MQKFIVAVVASLVLFVSAVVSAPPAKAEQYRVIDPVTGKTLGIIVEQVEKDRVRCTSLEHKGIVSVWFDGIVTNQGERIKPTAAFERFAEINGIELAK